MFQRFTYTAAALLALLFWAAPVQSQLTPATPRPINGGTVVGAEPITVEAPIQPVTDAYLEINFLKNGEDGNYFTVPSDGRGSIRCVSELGLGAGATFRANFDPGDRDAQIGLASKYSPYRCSGQLEGHGVTSFNTQVIRGIKTTRELGIFPVDAVIGFVIRDRIERNPVVGLPVRVKAFTDTKSPPPFGSPQIVELRTGGAFSGGAAIVSVVGGQRYRVALQRISTLQQPSLSEPINRSTIKTKEGIYYFTPDVLEPVEIEKEGNKEYPIYVEKSDSSIEVSLTDVNGDPIEGWVRAESPVLDPNDDEQFPLRFEQSIPQNGTVAVPLVSGRKFTIRAGPKKERGEEVDEILPEPFEITPVAGENGTHPFEMREPNYTLTISVSAESSQGDSVPIDSFDHIACFAYNAERAHSFSQSLQDGAISLSLLTSNLSRRESWRVGCHGIESTGEQSRQFFIESDYRTIGGGEAADTISLTMGERGTAYPPKAERLTIDQESEVVLPDGRATLRVPANAFGSSGNAEITVQTALGWRTDLDSAVLEAWELTPTVDDETVEEPEDLIELCMPIDEDELAELGTDPEDVKIARYDDEEQRWVETDTTLSGTEGNYFACGSVDHFSIWGTIIDVISAIQAETPSDLRVQYKRQVKNRNRFIVNWQEIESSISSTVTYTVRFKSPRKRKQCKRLDTSKFRERDVSGRSRIRVKTKQNSLCAEVLVKDASTSTSRKFRKSR